VESGEILGASLGSVKSILMKKQTVAEAKGGESAAK